MTQPDNIITCSGKVHLYYLCPFCGHTELIIVTTDQFVSYFADGEYAQTVFSDLSEDQRETIISGMCVSCQERWFSK